MFTVHISIRYAFFNSWPLKMYFRAQCWSVRSSFVWHSGTNQAPHCSIRPSFVIYHENANFISYIVMLKTIYIVFFLKKLNLKLCQRRHFLLNTTKTNVMCGLNLHSAGFPPPANVHKTISYITKQHECKAKKILTPMANMPKWKLYNRQLLYTQHDLKLRPIIKLYIVRTYVRVCIYIYINRII